jgi:hypothetical protein
MVFVGLLLRDGTTAITSAFLGCGLMLVGSLLPRLTGTIKVTPGSIELALAERLEATRREAEARAPELEEAALLRAVEDLLPKLLTTDAGRDPAIVPPGDDRARGPSVRGRWAWAAAGAATALVGLVGAATVLELASTRTGDVRAPPAEAPPTSDDAGADDGDDGGDPPEFELEPDPPGTDIGTAPDPPGTPTGAPDPDDGPGSVVAVWALASLASIIALLTLVRRRARSRAATGGTSLDLEPAPAFARRIVDDLVHSDRRPGDRP